MHIDDWLVGVLDHFCLDELALVGSVATVAIFMHIWSSVNWIEADDCEVVLGLKLNSGLSTC